MELEICALKLALGLGLYLDIEIIVFNHDSIVM
jgi:hypothetical protein